VAKHNQHLTQRQSTKRREPFDYLIYFFTVATPLFELPQAYVIYAHHAAQNVSIWSWGFFVIDNIVWVFYGIRNRMKPLIITSVLYLLIEMIIVIGIVKYS